MPVLHRCERFASAFAGTGSDPKAKGLHPASNGQAPRSFWTCERRCIPSLPRRRSAVTGACVLPSGGPFLPYLSELTVTEIAESDLNTAHGDRKHRETKVKRGATTDAPSDKPPHRRRNHKEQAEENMNTTTQIKRRRYDEFGTAFTIIAWGGLLVSVLAQAF